MHFSSLFNRAHMTQVFSFLLVAVMLLSPMFLSAQAPEPESIVEPAIEQVVDDGQVVIDIIKAELPNLSQTEAEQLYHRAKFEGEDPSDMSVINSYAVDAAQEVSSFGSEEQFYIENANLILNQDGSYEAIFSVQNSGSVETDVKFRFVLKDPFTGNDVYYVQTPESYTLVTGQSSTYSLDMKLPPYLSGKYMAAIEVANSAGQPITSTNFSENVFALEANATAVAIDRDSCRLTIASDPAVRYNLVQGVDVASDEQLLLSCDVSNFADESMTLQYQTETFFRSSWGDSQGTTPITDVSTVLAAYTSDTITVPVPMQDKPQSYDVQFDFLYENNSVAAPIYVHYVLQGNSATIQKVTPDKLSYVSGDVATVVMEWVGRADHFADARVFDKPIADATEPFVANVQLLDHKGKICSESVSQTLTNKSIQEGSVISVPVNKNCESVFVKSSIQTSDGETLYEIQGSFTDVSPASDSSKPSMIDAYVLVALASIALLAVLLVTQYLYRWSPNWLVGMIVSLLVGIAIVAILARSAPLTEAGSSVDYIYPDSYTMCSQPAVSGGQYQWPIGLELSATVPSGSYLSTEGISISFSARDTVSNNVIGNSNWGARLFLNTSVSPADQIGDSGVSSLNHTFSGLAVGSYRLEMTWNDNRCINIGEAACYPTNPNTSCYTPDPGLGDNPSVVRNYYFTVTAPSAASPTVTLTRDASSVTAGNPVTVGWTSTGSPDACDLWSVPAVSSWTGAQGPFGSETMNLSSNTTFFARCYNSAGEEDTDSISVSVTPPAGSPPVIDLSVTSPITSGSLTTIDWDVSGTGVSCTASSGGGGGWSGPVSNSGLYQDYPTSDATYTLNCLNSYDSDSDSKLVTVNPIVSVSKPSCAIPSAANRTIVNFGGQRMRSDRTDRSVSPDQSVSLSDGTYNVTLMSWDGYSGREISDQPNERWRVDFLDGTNVLTSSGVIRDLEDLVVAAQKIETVSTDLVISTPVVAVRAVHYAYPDYTVSNSVFPICAAFDETTPTPPSGPVPNVNLTVSPGNSVFSGESVTLNWEDTTGTATNCATSWAGNQAYTGSDFYTEAVNGNTTYTVSCTNTVGTSNPPEEETVTVNPVGVTLDPPAPPNVDVGGETVLTWSSTGTTGLCTGSPESIANWSGPILPLSDSAAITVNGSVNYTIICNTTIGTTVSASTYIAVPVGFLSVGNCDIPVGDSYCSSDVTWQGQSFLGDADLNQRISGSYTTVLSDSGPNFSNINNPVDINPDRDTFILNDDGGSYERGPVSGTASCVSTSVWISRPAGISRCEPLPVITISSEDTIVSYRDSTTYPITVDAPYEVNCVLRGGSTDSFNFVGTPSATSGTYDGIGNILTSTTITEITCTSTESPLLTASEQSTTRVVPSMQEI